MKFFRDLVILLLLVGCSTYGLRSWHHSRGGGRVICDPAKLKEGEICLETVYEKWQGEVLWVDARSESDWEKSTLDGALCLNPSADPTRWDELMAEAMPRLMEAGVTGKPIVVFCQSAKCGASKEVADRLRDPGEYAVPGEIYVLYNGWQAIQRYPYAKLTESY